jgi:hypothetical protein
MLSGTYLCGSHLEILRTTMAPVVRTVVQRPLVGRCLGDWDQNHRNKILLLMWYVLLLFAQFFFVCLFGLKVCINCNEVSVDDGNTVVPRYMSALE